MKRTRPAWWSRRSPVAAAWMPLAVLFLILAGLRRLAFHRGWLRSASLPVRVIVVGNIAVGGSGKTPVVIWLVQALMRRGYRPGILSRGYGGAAKNPCRVVADSDPLLVGDEPVLLARRCDCPVWVGRDRLAAGRALLEAHPEIDVLVTDDGLQHYPLRRDAEIVVLDEAILGNCWPLPAGPLREPLSRLSAADLLVCNGAFSPSLLQYLPPVPRVTMLLQPGAFYRLDQPGVRRSADSFGDVRGCAIAGIAYPERFFKTLRGLGVRLEQTRAFPDHHAFVPADLRVESGQILLLTEKDAVKCTAFPLAEAWVLPVEARLDEAALDCLLERLHGPETA